MKRKLATIQIINEINQHPNAEKLEIARVLGWKVVVGKGEFSVGDKIIYCEVDSVLPEKPEFEFLRKNHFRVRIVRLRGEYSNGLILPINLLDNPEQYNVGDEVTETLGIYKYEPEIPASIGGDIKGNFPSFFPKTDELRLQSVPDLVDEIKDKDLYATEKLDGTSMSCYYYNGEFGVCGRNWELKDAENNLLWRTAKRLNLHNTLPELCKSMEFNFALQGELIGPQVQGNKYKLLRPTFYLFNIWDIDNQQRLDVFSMVGIAKYLRIDIVPVDDMCLLTTNDLKTVDDYVEYSQGKSELNSEIEREGIVVRTIQSDFCNALNGDVSFKVINPKFKE